MRKLRSDKPENCGLPPSTLKQLTGLYYYYYYYAEYRLHIVRKYTLMNYNTVSGDRIPVGGQDFPYSSRPALGPNQPRIQKVLGLCPGIKQPGRGVDHSPPSAELKERVDP